MLVINLVTEVFVSEFSVKITFVKFFNVLY